MSPRSTLLLPCPGARTLACVRNVRPHARPRRFAGPGQEGRLQAVLSKYIPVERYVYATYLPTRHVPAKVRTVIDFLLARFGPKPYWDGS